MIWQIFTSFTVKKSFAAGTFDQKVLEENYSSLKLRASTACKGA